MAKLNHISQATDEKASAYPHYSLRIASKLTDTSVYSIRQYIDKGLLIPFRTPKNRHLFSDVDITCLKCIKKFLTVQGLNIAGIKAMYAMIPCWVLRPCSADDRKSCDAYYSTSFSCWEASEKSEICKNSDCRVCEVYRLTENCKDVKDLLRKLL